MSKESKFIFVCLMFFALCVLAVWIVGVSYAARVVSDNTTQVVESCMFDTLQIPCLLNSHGGINSTLDYVSVPAGSHTVRARYCVQNGLWCSDWSNPLEFTKPLIPSVQNPRLSK